MRLIIRPVVSYNLSTKLQWSKFHRCMAVIFSMSAELLHLQKFCHYRVYDLYIWYVSGISAILKLLDQQNRYGCRNSAAHSMYMATVAEILPQFRRCVTAVCICLRFRSFWRPIVAKAAKFVNATWLVIYLWFISIYLKKLMCLEIVSIRAWQ